MNWSGLLAKIFLFLWIILIPSSLAYHFNEESALVNGILVDYRIPTISASTIALIGFIATLSLSLFMTRHDASYRQKLLREAGKVGTLGIIISLLLQLSISLFQFRFQRSLTGYFPLGEVAFTDTLISKGTFFNGVVYKLPYGTTAHPNVLAGFSVVAFLIICSQQFIRISRGYKALLFLATALVCFLTQSLTASIALGLGTLVLLAYGTKLTKLARLSLIFLPLITFLILTFPNMLTHPNTSISRRAQLQQIALKMIAGQPILGIGWNNYTLLQEDHGYVPGTTRFLQPLHHSFLLLVVELGILGWIINFLFHLFILKVHSVWLPVVTALVLISSFDHYPVTLSTGRMLLVLILLAAFLHKSKPKLLII